MLVNIKGCDGWWINEDGRVFHGKKEIHPYRNNRTLCFDVMGKRHSLMATVYNTFNGTDVDGRQLYFVNGDPTDCRLCNIKKREPRPTERHRRPKGSHLAARRGRRVYCEETGKTYQSLKECYQDLGVSAVTVSYAIYNTTNGMKTRWHIWDAKSEPQTEEEIQELNRKARESMEVDG